MVFLPSFLKMTHLDGEGKNFKSVSFESSHSSLEKQSEEKGCHLQGLADSVQVSMPWDVS